MASRATITRRTLALALATILTGPTLTSPAHAAATAWTQDGYGPGNTGYNPAETSINTNTIGKLKPRWTVTPKPGTPGCDGPASPVIADGRMYIVDAGGVGAYNTTNGHLIWRDPTVMQEQVGRTLTLTGGLIVTTGWSCYGNSNPSGNMAALDAKTGKQRWRLMLGDAIEHVVADKGMIVAFAACDICSSRSVTGIRASDGAVRWSYLDASTGPVSANGRVLISGATGAFAVDITTGKALWRSPNRMFSTAANPAGDQFYAGTPAGGLAAVDAATGKIRWVSQSANTGPVAADGRRVFVAGADVITAYDAANGKRLWQRTGIGYARPIRAGGLLYITGGVLSPVDGSTVSAGSYSSAYYHAVVVGGRLYQLAGGKVRTFTP